MLTIAPRVPLDRHRRALLLARRDVVLAELRRTQLARRLPSDVDVHRLVERLTRELGRCPRVTEVAAAAGAEVEDVLEALVGPASAPPGAGRAKEHRELWMWLRGGLDRGEIARRTGATRLEVARRLRASLRARNALRHQ